MATKTPNPSAAASSRRRMPPPPTPAAALSPPFSPAPFRPRLGAPAVAGGCGAAAGSSFSVERPCVKLWEWWLARVEGEDRKLAVSGYTEKNDAFTSAPIAKRYEPLTLEDEDGLVLLLDGSMSLPRMLENEFSPQICETFLLGFPYWWETWDSHMENFPKCFINPREDSSQFYLQKFQLGKFLEKLGPSFIENLLSNAKSNSLNDADTFTDCSRFEEYTCGSDFSTKEISAEPNDDIPAPVADEVEETDLLAGSSDFSTKEISAESNDDIPAPVADEVEETDLIAGSSDFSTKEISAESNDDIPAPVADEVEETDLIARSSDFSTKEISAESNDDIPAPVADEVEETDLIAGSSDFSTKEIPAESNDDIPAPVADEVEETDLIAGSSDFSTKEISAESNDDLPAPVADEVEEADLIAGSPSQQRDNVDIHCNLSSGPTETCSGDETCKETGNQNDTMHPDARELEAGSHLVNSNLIVSRSPDCMPSELEDRNNSAEDLVSKCLLAAIPPEKANFCSEIAGTLQSVEPLSYQSTPESSLKNQACLKMTELITLSQEVVPNEDTSTPVHLDVQTVETSVDPAEKQGSAQKLLRFPTRSPRIRSPILYAHHAPFTRARAQSLSISTPESLKMKRTKSGRVVVPPLDPGSERIVYAKDHTISGVSPVFQSPPKGSSARKRKRKAL